MAVYIGITTYGADENTVVSEGIAAFYAVPSVYVDAVRRAGGVPVLLAPGETDLAAWVALCDGFVMAGGADIDPARYGGRTGHPQLGPVIAARDATEAALLEMLLNGDKPVLAICRGLQMLNVVMGGTLHEHIAEIHPDNIHQGQGDMWTMQEVRVEPDSRLAAIMGAATVTTMSGHHQGINRLAAGLTVTAKAADGIIEAVEHSSHPYCIAVQWHPEMTAHSDPSQQALFDDLVRKSEKHP